MRNESNPSNRKSAEFEGIKTVGNVIEDAIILRTPILIKILSIDGISIVTIPNEEHLEWSDAIRIVLSNQKKKNRAAILLHPDGTISYNSMYGNLYGDPRFRIYPKEKFTSKDLS